MSNSSINKDFDYHFIKWVQARCVSLFELEERGDFTEDKLKHCLYKIGVQVYRNFHDLEPVATYAHPSRFAQTLSESVG